MANNEWLQLSQQLHDELNVIKRDALVPYVIAADSQAEDERDLYEKLLIDVEMGSCGTTSKVEEAIAATQLFFHRYFVNLEAVDGNQSEAAQEALKQRLKTYWQWMKNYRVWEANRKVFLHPENYIRPELRDSKTPTFKVLEEDLLQGEITDETVQRAYQKYLEEYTEVSRLTIVGGYVYDSTDQGGSPAKSLVLFGRTKTDPRRYYYRMTQFLGGDKTAIWNSWLKVNLQIDADKVYPVFAFNRVFVFWVKLETTTETRNTKSLTLTDTSANGNRTISSSTPSATHVLKIYYSFYNLNKEWLPPQTLKLKDDKTGEKTEIKIHPAIAINQITNISLLVETSDQLNPSDAMQGEHENIMVQCVYDAPDIQTTNQPAGTFKRYPDGTATLYHTFSLTPELYTVPIPKTFEVVNTGKATFQAIFEEAEISNDQVVMFNAVQQSADGPWFSFDHKGGSFLCKPAASLLTAELWPKELKKKRDRLPEEEPDRLPEWDMVDAAVQLPSRRTIFFKNDRNNAARTTPQSYVLSDDLTTAHSIKAVWGKVGTNINKTGIVNSGYVDRTTGKTYLFSGDQYFVYSNNVYDWVDDGFPKDLSSQTTLPPWDEIDAVFQGKDNRVYYFNNTTKKYRVSDSNQERNIKDWASPLKRSGFISEFTRPDWNPGAPSVDAGFVYTVGQGDKAIKYTYLVNRNQFVRYTGSEYRAIDSGYPKTHTFWDLLIDLDPTVETRLASQKETLETQIVVAAYDQGSTIHFATDLKTKTNNTATTIENYIFEKDGNGIYTLRLGFTFFDGSWTAGFAIGNVVYRINGQGLRMIDSSSVSSFAGSLNGHINAAFLGANGQVYIFKRDDYISFQSSSINGIDSLVRVINAWRNSQANEHKWDFTKGDDSITIDAAFCDGDKVYLFSGDDYIVYSGDVYPPPKSSYPDAGYPKKLNKNTEDLPQWSKLGAVLPTPNAGNSKGAVYFFDNDDLTYVKSGDLTTKLPTKAKWGRVKTNIADQGIVDAAVVIAAARSKTNYLFLTSGNQIFRYTLMAADQTSQPSITPTLKEVSEFVDEGYPKPFNWEVKQIDAAFNLTGETYFIAGDRYLKLQPLDSNQDLVELKTPPSFKPIQGNWGNLPRELRFGMDGALNVTNDDNTQDLFLFRGGQYIKYTNVQPRTGRISIQPFELDEVRYEIVRLTTSTAYRLNQELFAGGLPRLLSLRTQEIDDTPSFSDEIRNPTTIKVTAQRVETSTLPSSSHLDFLSANGIYYWEIFFHAPCLIAQTLNLAQQFEAAKTWYEYIYDPTGVVNYWKFLPFLAIDIQSLIAAGRSSLAQLKRSRAKGVAEVENALDLLLTSLEPLTPAFQLLRSFHDEEKDYLNSKQPEANTLWSQLTSIKAALAPEKLTVTKTTQPIISQLNELIGMIEQLNYRYQLLLPNDAQVDAYLTDPFDPHAIAALRPIAYRRAIVMAYIDNLLDWGDMLFQQYTRESINEARMLYILVYDLLGSKPEVLGNKVLPPTHSFADLLADTDNPEKPGLKALTEGDQAYDFLVYPSSNTSNDKVLNPYFFIPENTVLLDYWSRVEDRLYKIRACMNILGISQPLPLFEPPIDPMALVQAVSSGASLSSALASLNIPVPHYRFSFMLRKAQDLVQKLGQFGNDLLSALEKKDAEELSLLQNRQEGIILEMTRSIKQAQVNEAKATIDSLNHSLKAAQEQFDRYTNWINEGFLPTEIAQMTLMSAAAGMQVASSVVRLFAAGANAAPDVLVGPFIMGIKYGGSNIGESINLASEVLQTLGEGLSLTGELLGIVAQNERSKKEWELQQAMASHEIEQIKAQIRGAEYQQIAAQQDLEILEKQIAHNQSVTLFMRDKFSNAQLYQWMASQLSGLYYQTYQMAFDLAKAAEKAFQFERGVKESEVNFINGVYWDSQRKGLLAGDSLGFDLDRMEKAFIESDRRGFEISKNISLLELDPMAFLQLKTRGVCEFALTESLFDYDFPGHYCRQIKTISLTFDAGEGQTVMATLTQLSHKTVLEPDLKAVKYLLDAKDQPPETLRSNWRANQQIALSYVDQYEKNNGMFELRFDDERYLPFEGTGAVSTWRLELNGKKGSYNINDLLDITINLKYTAEQGGTVFAKAVKGLLKPYETARFFDMQYDFPDEWNAFLDDDSNELVLPMSRDRFPNMGSNKIFGIFTTYDLYEPDTLSMVLNYQDSLTLKDRTYLMTNSLSIGSRGADWSLTLNGDKTKLRNINFVVTYQATVT